MIINMRTIYVFEIEMETAKYDSLLVKSNADMGDDEKLVEMFAIDFLPIT